MSCIDCPLMTFYNLHTDEIVIEQAQRQAANETIQENIAYTKKNEDGKDSETNILLDADIILINFIRGKLFRHLHGISWYTNYQDQ